MPLWISPDLKINYFDYVWLIMASEGLVDSYGSVEYKRQVQTWRDKGMPIDPLPIEVHGHITPDGFSIKGKTEMIPLLRLKKML